ncbi:MAG TPA: glycoside hydrolase family 43 protein [Acidimicrobiales bacterium]|nr:glycoside hydrolase family 43 protein [Acidimicrobiales bacterium]
MVRGGWLGRLGGVGLLSVLAVVGLLAVPSARAAGGGSPPVWSGDFPDPYVLRVGPLYFAYGTDADLALVPTMVSADLTHWQWVGDALGGLPRWAAPGSAWGPSVMAAPGDYVLFYAALDAATGQHCISRAVSRVPQGPFTDDSAGPLICQSSRGGSIDPSPFADSGGATYLVWKSEGIRNLEPTRIWSAPLAPDGSRLIGSPSQLITTDQGWEGPIVEGPDLARVGGRYYLLYSANRWDSAAYAIGYAVCSGPLGPCVKPSTAPLWSSQGTEVGPGGPCVFSDAAGQTYVAYHAWTAPDIGYDHGGKRSLHIANLSAQPGTGLAMKEG